MKRWLKPFVPVRLRRWFRGIFPHQIVVTDEKYGCRMLSARSIESESEKGTIIEEIRSLGPWFHNFEIASDIWTNSSGRLPGIGYPMERWRLIEALLPDVRGKSCLDVGCSSGFFSLKLKELGAAYVLGVDFEQQPQAIEQAKFAARTLGLDVDFRTMSVYDLGTVNRRFDIILFMGVFYHLRHPLLALETVRALCAETMILQTITSKHEKQFVELDRAIISDVDLRSPIMTDHRFPAIRFVEGTLNGDATCWFVPNLQAVTAMLRSAHFRPSEVTFTNEQDIIIRCTPIDSPR